jgi:FAD/FMN-containing dehydrogenase
MLIDQLKSIVGERDWSTDPSELAPHLTEWRDRFRGKTCIMVSPRTTAQVSDIVKACAAAGTAVIPQGGNTGLCGGAIPDMSGEQVLLSLSRLNAIRKVDVHDSAIVVDAGCILADVQQAAREVGRFFPLSLSAEGSCQIGGNLATNAGGINVLRYGTARQQVLGLEVVLADGTVWDGLRSLRKDTAGYDMKQLFIGSEGTLGVITAATLKLYPDPGETTTSLLALSAAGDAVEILAMMRERLGAPVQAFELMSDRCLRFVERHVPDAAAPFKNNSPWYVLCDVARDNASGRLESVLAVAAGKGLISDAIIAKNQMESDRLWRIRHSISEAQKSEGVSIKHDISVPVGSIGVFLQRSNLLLEQLAPEARLVAFGHVGDGNLHYNISQPAGADGAEFRDVGERLTAAIYDLVDELGGSFSAEHGVGVLKKDQLRRYRGGAELSLMRKMKAALDPNNTLNPGKVI